MKLFESNKNLSSNQKELEIKQELNVLKSMQTVMMDLLSLPTSLKKELLSLTQGKRICLIQEMYSHQSSHRALPQDQVLLEVKLYRMIPEIKLEPPVSEHTKQMDKVFF